MKHIDFDVKAMAFIACLEKTQHFPVPESIGKIDNAMIITL